MSETKIRGRRPCGLRVPVTNDELEAIAFKHGVPIDMGGKRPTCTVFGVTYVGGAR